MNNPEYTNLPMGAYLLAVADALVEHHDVNALRSFNRALVELILANVTGEDVSLIEINEYISEAIGKLTNGRTPAEVKASSIRRLLSDGAE